MQEGRHAGKMSQRSCQGGLKANALYSSRLISIKSISWITGIEESLTYLRVYHLCEKLILLRLFIYLFNCFIEIDGKIDMT